MSVAREAFGWIGVRYFLVRWVFEFDSFGILIVPALVGLVDLTVSNTAGLVFLVCLRDWLFGYFGDRIVVFGFGTRRNLGGVGNLGSFLFCGRI